MDQHNTPAARGAARAAKIAHRGDLSRFAQTPSPLGLSATVYSTPWPFTQREIAAALGEGADGLLRAHQSPWLKAQDGAEKGFFSAWLGFASPALLGGREQFRLNFPEMYPTAGSSEGIRESIHQLASAPRRGAVVVFNGEYEGYEAIARADGLDVLKIDRNAWREQLGELAESPQWGGGRFYVSQPSSIDGESWSELPEFLDFAQERFGESLPIALDLTYLGICAPSEPIPTLIPASHKAIDQVFFSLSKPFGVYYRRIGGVFSRKPMPTLWGNRWFKNLDSLALGERLLRSRAEPFSAARGAAAVQAMAIEWANAGLGEALRELGAVLAPASVALLATLRPAEGSDASRWEEFARKGEAAGMAGALAKLARRGEPSRPAASWRLCLSPLIGELLQEAGDDAEAWLQDPQQAMLLGGWPKTAPRKPAKTQPDIRVAWGLDGEDENCMFPAA